MGTSVPNTWHKDRRLWLSSNPSPPPPPTTTTTTTASLLLLFLFAWHLDSSTILVSADNNTTALTPHPNTSSSSSSSADLLHPLTIGYLPIDKTHPAAGYHQVVKRQHRVISGALTYAIEVINKKRMIPGYRVGFVWNDTHGTISGGLQALTDQWRHGVDMFLGPEETCHYEGRLAAAWNLPMLSFKCADDEVSDKDDYPTFARTRPPAAQVTTSVLSLLLHFNWTRFSLIVGSTPGQQKMAQRLLELAENNNLTVNHKMDFKEPHVSLMAGNPFPEIVQETFVETRVYVFLGQLNAMVDFMTNLNDRGLLMTGDYVVIFIDQRSRTQDNNPLKYFKRTFDSEEVVKFRDGERTLLIITPTAVASTTNTSLFHEKVLEYNALPPFEFPNPFNFTKQITDYAAYLYDAVWLYAVAVAEVLNEGGSVRNGTAIVDRIRSRSYRSILGYNTRIDENGDAAGHYTLLAFKEHHTEFYNYSMKPVAQFEMTAGDRPIFRMFARETIPWVNGQPPVAEPRCGYLGQRCIAPKTYIREIVLGVFGGVALVFAVISLIVYRNWRYEQEIDGLLWKVPFSSIQMAHNFTGLACSNDKQQPRDGGVVSIVSTESRNSYTQVFAQTGIFKGQTVALKCYEKRKIDLGRHTKKEMKLLRDLRHDNVNDFIGASVDSDYLVLVTEYCGKGSLTDVLENEDISRSLDGMFLSSLVKDLLQGMIYLHDSELQYHGALKSSNCLITSRWTLQIGDFGLLDVRAMTYKPEDVFAYFRNMLWKAPELLRSAKPHRGSLKGDVYSFGIILYEMFGRSGPYGHCKLSPKEIVDNVKNKALAGDNPFRPDVTWLTCDDYITSCMQECWVELPEQRPDFKLIWQKFKPMRVGVKRNIFDNMMSMMEKYQERLEDLVEERTLQLVEEKKKTETLLHRMLPRTVAEQLKRGEAVVPESFDSVTIYFSDICGFTNLSAESTPMEVVDMLNDLYTTFDFIVRHFDVYKVETIGDAYMVVSGLPLRNGDLHAGEVASMALALLTAIKSFHIRHRPEETLKLRIGIHSGSCVSGVVGLTMPRYTLFGDTVNTASRMETNGEPLKVHCSSECKTILDKLGGYTLEERGYVSMKGKGNVLTYWLTGENPDVRKARLRRIRRNFHISGSSDVTDLVCSPSYSPSPCSASPCLRPSYLSSSPNSHSPSPNHSPMLSSKSSKAGAKVKVADSAAGSPVVFNIFKDADSARGGTGEVLNGMSLFRGRLHSFKDAMHRKAKMTPTDSEPVIPEPQNLKAPKPLVGVPSQLAVPDRIRSLPTEVTATWTPVLKGRHRDNSSAHRLSSYDNAPPSELSVLLDERVCASEGFPEDRREEESSFYENSSSLQRL